ncbi:MAG: hypothetical protein MUC96_01075 [Myxococcaceae bacterium]|jgi:hypothetical protein|nr:hypothetical protein [Myxococcaceae bacterium]
MTRTRFAIVVALFTSTALAQETNAPETEWAPKQALLARVGVASMSPGGGVSFERLVSQHLAIVVGVDGSFVQEDTWSRAGGSGEVGARWYFFDRPLSGPWLGLSLTGGASESTRQSTLGLGGLGGLNGGGGLGGSSGTTQAEFTTRQLQLGGQLLVGWTFRFDNRLTIQLAAGPSGQVTRSRHLVTTELGGTTDTVAPTTGARVGLTGFVALGVAL